MAFLKFLSPDPGENKIKSVVETTEQSSQVWHNVAKGKATHPGVFFDKNVSTTLADSLAQINQSVPSHTRTQGRGKESMPEQEGRYVVGLPPYASKTSLHGHIATMAAHHPPVYKKGWLSLFSRLSLPQKILLSNLIIVGGSAVVGSFLVAQLAEAGQFNVVTFGIIIVSAVLLSGSISFWILQRAFRPFEDLQQVLAKIHTGNPRARAALRRITDPDVRHFTSALNQMLNRLEENARVIQEDQKQLQLMTARVLNAQENERKRIARELHDEASQALTAMIMGLESARSATEDNALQNKLGSLKDLAALTLEELRKLALDLRPTMLDDLGLVPAVRWLTRTAAERGHFEINIDLGNFDTEERLSAELETCLFRITQESLNNIVKHAKARKVTVKLENLVGEAAVRLTVRDNGKGFDRSAAKAAAYSGGHLGLFDIEERATLLGGFVEIDTSCSGTTLSVTIPTSGLPVEAPQGIDTHAAPYTQPYHH